MGISPRYDTFLTFALDQGMVAIAANKSVKVTVQEINFAKTDSQIHLLACG
jgi:hypothetical protein